MCGRFSALSLEQVMELVRAMRRGDDGGEQLSLPAPEAERHVRPGDRAPVIVEGENGLQALEMTWGFDVSWSRNLVFNTRIERAHDSHGMWTDCFASGRCIVLAWEFFEPHKTETEASPTTGRPVKAHYGFKPMDSSAFMMAGVFQGDRFSVVTTMPDDVVAGIHDRMPLLLDWGSADLWLGRNYREITAARIPLAAEREVRPGGQMSLLW